MTLLHYRNTEGAYLGVFDSASAPDGAIVVPFPPFKATFRWVDGDWIETYSTAYLRSVVNALRDNERATIWLEGHRIDSNPAALTNIIGRSVAYSVSGRLEPSTWITADNDVINLTEAQFFAMAHAVDAAIDAAYMRAGACKAKIADGTLTTEDQVREYWNEVLGGPLS